VVAGMGRRPMIAMAIVISVIHMAMEVPRAMEPGTGSDEDAARKPLWAVIAIRSAVVRGHFVVAVRTSRGSSYAHRYLSRRLKPGRQN
jgi:hypothetical protein